jgi:hypothetical protein
MPRNGKVKNDFFKIGIFPVRQLSQSRMATSACPLGGLDVTASDAIARLPVI